MKFDGSASKLTPFAEVQETGLAYQAEFMRLAKAYYQHNASLISTGANFTSARTIDGVA